MREYSIGTLLEIGAGLDAGLVQKLIMAGDRISLSKGQPVYAQGEAAGHVFLLLTGQAKSILRNRNGGECLLRIHLPHSLMGLTSLSTAAVRDAEAVIIADAELIRIDRSHFRDLMTANPDFGLYVIELLANRMSDFHYRVGEFLAQNVEQRLAQTLLSISRGDPEATEPHNRSPIRLTHEELASLLGARRPTITAIINRFAADGLVAKRGRTIDVIDPDRLSHLLPSGA
jgi:CRP/FNR family transcriptional regulator, cyclic AMP receptor protein